MYLRGSPKEKVTRKSDNYDTNPVHFCYSIQMGNEDLGKHFEAIGDVEAAMDSYWKMRPDVSSTEQLVDIGKLLVRVAIERHDWKSVANHLSKHVNSANDSDPKAKALKTYARIANGIAALGQERYKEAAFSFVEANSDVSPEVYNQIASPNDVAIYGGLLALATMDRHELQAHLLDNDSFREFLQREPHIRRAITQFVNGRYAACIEILESYRPDYLLDIYLQKHVPKLYADIRTKSIVQYLKPFSCVRLDTMQKAFNGPGPSIEDELFTMIKDGKLNARIDAINKVCHVTSLFLQFIKYLFADQTSPSFKSRSCHSPPTLDSKCSHTPSTRLRTTKSKPSTGSGA